MKKITLVLLLTLFTSAFCHAQKKHSKGRYNKGGNEIGLTLGGGYTLLSEDDRFSGVNYGTGNGVRGLVGVSYKKSLNDIFFTSAGLLFELGGYDVTYTEKGPVGEEDTEYSASYNNHYTVPILIGMNIQRTGFYVNAGPYVGFHMMKSIESNFAMNTQPAQSFSIGLAAGVGYGMHLTNELKLSAELRQNVGLVNFNEDPINFKINSTALLLGIHYVLQ